MFLSTYCIILPSPNSKSKKCTRLGSDILYEKNLNKIVFTKLRSPSEKEEKIS